VNVEELLNVNVEELADSLRLAVGRLARQLRQQSQGGLTPSQRSVLATLFRHGPVTMGVLAEFEGISRPSTTGIVSRLQERGLVERRDDADDGRCAVVGLTPSGSAEVERRRSKRTAFLVQRLEGLDDDERAALAAAIPLLDRLLDDPR
jgi:DNA-binding MarR family transcriptional regulator